MNDIVKITNSYQYFSLSTLKILLTIQIYRLHETLNNKCKLGFNGCRGGTSYTCS